MQQGIQPKPLPILSVRVRRGGGSGVIWESENKQTNKQSKSIWEIGLSVPYMKIQAEWFARVKCAAAAVFLFLKIHSLRSHPDKNVDREGMDFNWCDPVSTGSPQKKNNTNKQTNTQSLTARYAIAQLCRWIWCEVENHLAIKSEERLHDTMICSLELIICR